MHGRSRNAAQPVARKLAPLRAWRVAAAAIIVLGALAGALGAPVPARAAAVLTVNTLADTLPATGECSGLPGDCSIRQALDAAEAGDSVVIPANPAPYVIVHEKIPVRGGVTISGAGAEATTLSGGGAVQIFNLLGPEPVTIRRLTLTHGHNDSGKDQGGAINDEGEAGCELILEGVTVSNSDSPFGFGGAIETGSNLVIRNSRFVDNSTATVRKKGGGGAIDLFAAEPAPTLTISDSVFEGNTVDKFAGGAILVENGSLVVHESTFAANIAGNGAPGGAIQLGASSQATILNSTFAGNAAGAGGAISAEGDRLTLVGDTFAGNAAEAGAGVAAEAGIVSAQNTIFAAPGGGAANCSGTVMSAGNNLDDAPVSSCGLGAAGDLVGAEPGFGPYGDNGSLVQAPADPPPTLALEPGSAAIGAGDPAACAAAGAVDERGFPRPGIEGGTCDIGAFELLAAVGTQTAITLPVAGSTLAEPFTLRAVVGSMRALPPAVPGLTGTVAFRAGATLLGVAPLEADGSATLAVPGLGGGAPAGGITAGYSGDEVYAASTSRPLNEGELPGGGAPVLSGLRQTHLHWRAGTALARMARDDARQGIATPLRRRRAPVGTTFGFRLSAPADVTVVFRLRVHGRRVGGRCLALASGGARARRSPPCRRWVGAGALRVSGLRAGPNRVWFGGRLSRSRRLRPGLYRALLSARNAAGRSATVPIVFRIVRR